jgi:hypothetical protein
MPIDARGWNVSFRCASTPSVCGVVITPSILAVGLSHPDRLISDGPFAIAGNYKALSEVVKTFGKGLTVDI